MKLNIDLPCPFLLPWVVIYVPSREGLWLLFLFFLRQYYIYCSQKKCLDLDSKWERKRRLKTKHVQIKFRSPNTWTLYIPSNSCFNNFILYFILRTIGKSHSIYLYVWTVPLSATSICNTLNIPQKLVKLSYVHTNKQKLLI